MVTCNVHFARINKLLFNGSSHKYTRVKLLMTVRQMGQLRKLPSCTLTAHVKHRHK